MIHQPRLLSNETCHLKSPRGPAYCKRRCRKKNSRTSWRGLEKCGDVGLLVGGNWACGSRERSGRESIFRKGNGQRFLLGFKPVPPHEDERKKTPSFMGKDGLGARDKTINHTFHIHI